MQAMVSDWQIKARIRACDDIFNATPELALMAEARPFLTDWRMLAKVSSFKKGQHIGSQRVKVSLLHQSSARAAIREHARCLSAQLPVHNGDTMLVIIDEVIRFQSDTSTSCMAVPL